MASKWESTRARIKMRRILTGVESGIRPAMQDAVNKLHKEVIANTPRNTGALEDQITSYVNSTGTVGEVGLRGKRAKAAGFYLRFLEFGTKGHDVKTGSKKKVLSDGDNTFGTKANIPAMAPHPILSTAWYREKPVIINKIAKVVNDAITQAQNL